MELARQTINLSSIKVWPKTDSGIVTDELVLEIISVDQITAFLDSMHLIPGVIRAYRVMPEAV
jgi:hypothetical protein